MRYSRAEVLDVLRQKGDRDALRRGEEELPAEVDDVEDLPLLSRLGLHPQDMTTKTLEKGARGDLP